MKNVEININDTVINKSPGGLCLADVPCNGDYNQKRNCTCILKGEGIVIDVKDVIIDYSTWPDGEDEGKILHRNCKIKCENGIGWTGQGAIIKMES
jgi:hypothetical protein